MNEPTFNPPPLDIPLSTPEPQKHSRLGIASFILAIVAFAIICVDLILVFSLSGGLNVSQQYTPIDMILSCVAGLTTLVGLGLGIASVVQKNAKKVFGIIGLVLNGLFLLGYCGIILINLGGLSGSL